jgi:transcriptional regulator with XRE-family HTH domain
MAQSTLKGQSPLGQLLEITQRIIRVVHGHSGGQFSPRKLIPVNPKTTGDYLLLKRIEANLSQPEVAVKARVLERTVRAWEHDDLRPTQAQFHHRHARSKIADDGISYLLPYAQFLYAEKISNRALQKEPDTPPEKMLILFARADVVVLGSGFKRLEQDIQKGTASESVTR